MALEDMSKEFERLQKRSHQELERLDEELVVAKAERDMFRSQAEIREVGINRLKKHKGDGDTSKTSDRAQTSSTSASTIKVSRDVGRETGKENVLGNKPDRRFSCNVLMHLQLADN